MPNVNEMTYNQRRSVGSKSELKLVRLLNGTNGAKYDSSPLKSLGIEEGPYYFCIARKEEDCGGTDILVRKSNGKVIDPDTLRLLATVQSKDRTSKKKQNTTFGLDLGIEAARFFPGGNKRLILDGGRDLWVPGYKITVTSELRKGVHLAVRDWNNTETQADYYALHSVDSTEYKFFRSDKVKEICKLAFSQIGKRYADLEAKLHEALYERTQYRSLQITNLLDLPPGIDVRCRPEGGKDGKRPVLQLDGEERRVEYSKALVYINVIHPESPFVEGEDYVVIRRKK